MKNRFIALLLITCIAADPVMWAALLTGSPAAVSHSVSNKENFLQEALTARLVAGFLKPFVELAASIIRLAPHLQPADGILNYLPDERNEVAQPVFFFKKDVEAPGKNTASAGPGAHSEASPSDLINQARVFHKAGNETELRRLLEDVLKRRPVENIVDQIYLVELVDLYLKDDPLRQLALYQDYLRRMQNAKNAVGVFGRATTLTYIAENAYFRDQDEMMLGYGQKALSEARVLAQSTNLAYKKRGYEFLASNNLFRADTYKKFWHGDAEASNLFKAARYFREAISQLKTVTALSGESEEASLFATQIQLATILALLARHEKEDKEKNLKEAERLVREVAQTAPELEKVITLQGQLAYIRGDVGAAERKYLEAWEKKKSFYAAEQLLALCVEQGRLAEAREWYARLEKPDRSDRYQFGKIAFLEGDFAGALTLWEPILTEEYVQGWSLINARSFYLEVTQALLAQHRAKDVSALISKLLSENALPPYEALAEMLTKAGLQNEADQIIRKFRPVLKVKKTKEIPVVQPPNWEAAWASLVTAKSIEKEAVTGFFKEWRKLPADQRAAYLETWSTAPLFWATQGGFARSLHYYDYFLGQIDAVLEDSPSVATFSGLKPVLEAWRRSNLRFRTQATEGKKVKGIDQRVAELLARIQRRETEEAQASDTARRNLEKTQQEEAARELTAAEERREAAEREAAQLNLIAEIAQVPNDEIPEYFFATDPLCVLRRVELRRTIAHLEELTPKLAARGIDADHLRALSAKMEVEQKEFHRVDVLLPQFWNEVIGRIVTLGVDEEAHALADDRVYEALEQELKTLEHKRLLDGLALDYHELALEFLEITKARLIRHDVVSFPVSSTIEALMQLFKKVLVLRGVSAGSASMRALKLAKDFKGNTLTMDDIVDEITGLSAAALTSGLDVLQEKLSGLNRAATDDLPRKTNDISLEFSVDEILALLEPEFKYLKREYLARRTAQEILAHLDTADGENRDTFLAKHIPRVKRAGQARDTQWEDIETLTQFYLHLVGMAVDVFQESVRPGEVNLLAAVERAESFARKKIRAAA